MNSGRGVVNGANLQHSLIGFELESFGLGNQSECNCPNPIKSVALTTPYSQFCHYFSLSLLAILSLYEHDPLTIIRVLPH